MEIHHRIGNVYATGNDKKLFFFFEKDKKLVRSIIETWNYSKTNCKKKKWKHYTYLKQNEFVCNDHILEFS